MSARIYAFDGLALPTYVQDGDRQDMGTGESLTRFQQIPLGGFYDLYGSSKSPQGIRPISKTGILWADTAAALVTSIDNLRAKLGVRGKLTIQMPDDSLRWQWARCVRVATPRTSDVAANNWCPYELSFITAAQHWYGVITTEVEWSWGDLTWTFGDGTAELGENGYIYDLEATGATISGLTVSVAGTQYTVGTNVGEAKPNNGGNINATNVIITVTAVTDTIHAIHWDNQTSGYSWAYEANLTTGQTVTIDMGAMSVVRSDTGNDYANFTPSDKSVWDVLSAGENTIVVSVDGNEGKLGTITTEFYDHYA